MVSRRDSSSNDPENVPAFLAAGLLFVIAAPPTWVAVIIILMALWVLVVALF